MSASQSATGSEKKSTDTDVKSTKQKTRSLTQSFSVPNLNQLDVQPQPSLNTVGEIISGKDRVCDFLTKVAKKHPDTNVLEKLQNDAIHLHGFMTYATTVVKDKQDAKNQNYTIKELPNFKLDAKDSPDAFFVFGNNDLNVMDEVAKCFLTCVKKPYIFVSGLGGHGTASGHIFGKSEAETIKHRLKMLGVPEEKIIIETKATNSEKNVTHTEKMMRGEGLESPDIKKSDDIKKYQFDHILIFGSPTNVNRQIRTFEERSTYPWKRLSCQPASLAEIKRIYYHNQRIAAINFIAILCETGKFLNYTLNENFMCGRPVIDEKKLKKAAQIYFEYYKLITRNKIDFDVFLEDYMEKYNATLLSRAKAKTPAEIKADLAARRETIVARWVKAIDEDFRALFRIVEHQFMPVLPAHLSLWQQDERLFPRAYGENGVEPSPRHATSPSPSVFK